MSRVDGETAPVVGVQEWLRPGEYDRVEALLADLKALGIRELRTGFSWADWYASQGRDWYDWLLPRLAREVNVLPCFTYTPPSLGIEPKTSAPPRSPQAYADFLDVMITRLGAHFTWVELWNEPNNLSDWDWRLDPGWNIYCEMIGAAAYWAKQRGKRTVLGGMSPIDPNWLALLCDRGVIDYIDAVGVHGFPGTWEFDWTNWAEHLARVRATLNARGFDPAIWITEAGYSTWRFDEFRQLCLFDALVQAPAARVYWYSMHDLHPDRCHQDGFHEDERHYHFGLKDARGRPKLLYRTWAAEGRSGVRALTELGQAAPADATRLKTAPKLNGNGKVSEQRPALITGGAGFIGTNLAARLLDDGRDVVIFDNLMRPGAECNLRWLHDTYRRGLKVQIVDVRDPYLVRRAVREAGCVFHLAAQVAVTTSLSAPVEDFEINARGTLNVLEALRDLDSPPPLVFTSSNKVYGALDEIELRAKPLRYEPLFLRASIDEHCGLDFHSPYGCSKGAADQYVLDYARTFGLPATVFRMSCIFGPHQFGNEDQGWVAHFLIRALEGQPITIYGDGRQVRDVLYVDDLIKALLAAERGIERLAGQAFNIGGGGANSLSLLELIEQIAKLQGAPPELRYDDWRSGDQKYYVSDINRFRDATGWAPCVSAHDGVAALAQWLRESRDARKALSSAWAAAER
jgi:CDP-paratose 2-epimerase